MHLIEQVGKLGPPAPQAGPGGAARAAEQPPCPHGVDDCRLALDSEERSNRDHRQQQHDGESGSPVGNRPHERAYRSQPHAVDDETRQDLSRRDHVVLPRHSPGQESRHLIRHEEPDQSERA